jgi:hypothetical protein
MLRALPQIVEIVKTCMIFTWMVSRLNFLRITGYLVGNKSISIASHAKGKKSEKKMRM